MNNSPIISNCTAETIRDAALALKAGHLVAFPTETVYGLGADARNPEAVKRIYEVKGRPSDHPLIVHISSINQLDKWAVEIPDYARKLALRFWPGPMTLILTRSEIVGDFITGGQDTIGLRVPSDPAALSLISEFEKISDSAIAAPSANRFGQVSPTSSADVLEELASYLSPEDQILDGGKSSIGIESTIIYCTNERPVILRTGFITRTDVDLVCGIKHSEARVGSEIKFSGSFEKHYSPKCQIFLEGQTIEGAAFFAMHSVETPKGMVRLSSPETEFEFAQTMYSVLRRADKEGFQSLVVQCPKGDGIAEAIRDRLGRASLGR